MSNEYVFVVQVFHLFCVILRVGSVGSGVPRLSPANFGEPLGVDLQGFDPDLPGDFDHHPPGDRVPAGEHGHVAVVQTVVAHGEALHLAQHHGGKQRARGGVGETLEIK